MLKKYVTSKEKRTYQAINYYFEVYLRDYTRFELSITKTKDLIVEIH